MSGQRAEGDGYAFWQRVLELDLENHRRRRTTAAMSRDFGVPGWKLWRWLNEWILPPADVAARIGKTVGMSPSEHMELLAQPVHSSGDPVTPG